MLLRDGASPGYRTTPRSGVVLIIVVGLSMVLLGLALSFMMRMRADSQDTRVVVAEAQARLMLHAAMMYLQEGSRLGWGDETFGWTDVRDGSLGPRPARNMRFKSSSNGSSTGTPVDGGLDAIISGASPPYTVGAPASYNIPVPSWWLGTTPYVAIPNDAFVGGDLPPTSGRVWPYPGAVARCPMAVPVQPPYATQLRVSYNPVNWPEVAPVAPAYGQPNWETPWYQTPQAAWKDPLTNNSTGRDWPIQWADVIFDPNRGSTGMLDPQPQADKWQDVSYVGAAGQKPDFISGAIQQGATSGDWVHTIDDGSTKTKVQLQVRDGTDNICWFRIYREVQADHDNDGIPAYDRVALYDPKNPLLKNWNVFVIACGCGPTRGYRFYDQTDVSDWENQNGYPSGTVTLGQDFAANSPVFQGLGTDAASSRAAFRSMLESSRVLWYRVEWTPLQGGGFVPEHYSWGGTYLGTSTWPGLGDLLPDQREGGYADNLRYDAPKSYGGCFKWVQRLDHEPPNW